MEKYDRRHVMKRLKRSATEYTPVRSAGRPLQTLAGRVYLQRVVMCMAKRLEYQKMSDYRPKLPLNNAYDYYNSTCHLVQ